MKGRTRGLYIGLLCTVALLLAACGKEKKFDASGYVRGTLDVLYKEEYKEHADYVKEEEADLKKEMEQEFLDEIDQALAGREITQEDKDAYAAFFRDSYKLAKYEVGGSKEKDDGSYEVTVTVEPCTLWKVYYAGIEEKLREFASTRDTFTDSEILNAQLEYMNECLEAPSYEDKQEVGVRVTVNKDKAYSIPDEDIETLESTMFPVE